MLPFFEEMEKKKIKKRTKQPQYIKEFCNYRVLKKSWFSVLEGYPVKIYKTNNYMTFP